MEFFLTVILKKGEKQKFVVFLLCYFCSTSHLELAKLFDLSLQNHANKADTKLIKTNQTNMTYSILF